MARHMHTISELPFSTRYVGDEEAIRINNMIDEELKKDRENMRKRKLKEVKVMLLGQAESGKSTLKKQFQLHYASKTLETELPSWRPVVLFNIISAVKTILDEVSIEFFTMASNDSGFSSASPTSTFPATSLVTESQRARWKSDLSQLRTRLMPLTAIQESLASELCGGAMVAKRHNGYVRAGWQSYDRTDARPRSPGETAFSGVTNLSAKTLAMVQDDVEDLWRHPAVKTLIKVRKLILQESAAFFLNNIRRIAISNYVPTTDDVLNVRIQTLGVVQHSFEINLGGQEVFWTLIDVGGARGQRHAWVPFFDDATAIIFIAPISAFDQYLEEDPRTNRIDDSLQLWTLICSNKLLLKAHLVLMLNKADLLKSKLKAGTKIRKFITSYGDRPNNWEEASEYFRAHFVQVHRRKDVGQRSLYVHYTSMLDIKATQSILVNVGEAIIHSHMSQTGLA